MASRIELAQHEVYEHNQHTHEHMLVTCVPWTRYVALLHCPTAALPFLCRLRSAEPSPRGFLSALLLLLLSRKATRFVRTVQASVFRRLPHATPRSVRPHRTSKVVRVGKVQMHSNGCGGFGMLWWCCASSRMMCVRCSATAELSGGRVLNICFSGVSGFVALLK